MCVFYRISICGLCSPDLACLGVVLKRQRSRGGETARHVCTTLYGVLVCIYNSDGTLFTKYYFVVAILLNTLLLPNPLLSAYYCHTWVACPRTVTRFESRMYGGLRIKGKDGTSDVRKKEGLGNRCSSMAGIVIDDRGIDYIDWRGVLYLAETSTLEPAHK